MSSLVNVIKAFLEKYIGDSIRHDSKAHLRVVLAGPPETILTPLFNSLTSNGTRDWQIPTYGSQLDVAILLIKGLPVVGSSNPSLSQSPYVSCECYWDHVINIRNAKSHLIMLAEPSELSNIPDSLVNTTETLGFTRSAGQDISPRDPLWNFIVQQIASTLRFSEGEIWFVLKEVTKECKNLDPATSSRVPWEIANALLESSTLGLSSIDTIAFAAGFPSIGSTGFSLRDSLKVLQSLKVHLDDEGLMRGIDKLKSTETAVAGSLQNSLDDLSNHIKRKAESSTAFALAPAWNYAPGHSIPNWWQSLNAEVLSQMLDTIENSTRPKKLNLQCENALNGSKLLKGEQWVVWDEVRLHASVPAGIVLPNHTFKRKNDNTTIILPADVNDDAVCIDPVPPPHSKSLKYTIEAPSLITHTIEVISLKTFECHGFARASDALRNTVPERPKGQTSWTQRITLPHGGKIDLDIYPSPDAQVVVVSNPPATPNPIRIVLVSGHSHVTTSLDIDDGDQVDITVESTAGQTLGSWSIDFTVQEPAGVVRSLFTSLVQAHQEKGTLKHVQPEQDTALKLETVYIQSPDSWKTVWMGCSGAIDVTQIDWSSPRMGDAFPQLKPFPDIDIPETVFLAREAVREYLKAENKPIAATDLRKQDLIPLVERYLNNYLEWLRTDSEAATWMDCIAIHAPLSNSQSSGYSATKEPVAVLLSPLHPLKLAWHCIAQKQLKDALDNFCLCPAAGLLEPSTCPDTGAWYISQGEGRPVPRAFHAASCDNPHWSIMWNTFYYNQDKWRESVLEKLADMGLASKGISGGFSKQQASDSLEEIAKLLPGRATLRAGIIGTNKNSPACAEGVVEWCSMYSDDTLADIRPFTAEIYDTRWSMYPSPEVLAELSEQTQEKVRWYRVGDIPSTEKLDLIILDQLDIQAPEGVEGSTRSPIAPGALYRVRIREDLNNGIVLRESRVGLQNSITSSLTGLLQEVTTAFENLALKDANISHFQFQPRQDAIGNRVKQSTYLAVTSSQVDPACIVRGTRGQSAYLWDFELPGILEGNEDNAGYYLIAEPLPSMRKAIAKSASLVVSSPLDIGALLDEISRRGIPILKQLASGGSDARGELGSLLAVRFLQDSFRSTNSGVQLPVRNDQCLHFLLPVDPYQEPFERIRRSLCEATTNEKRPDFIVIAIKVPKDQPIELKMTPVEVKFRNEPMNDLVVLREYLRQAENFGQILDALWVQPAPSDLWATCRSAMLAQCLDFMFRIYSDAKVHGQSPESWAKIHQRVIKDIVNNEAQIQVNKEGRLLVFDSSATTTIVDLDGDQQKDTVIVCRDDARILLTSVGTLSREGQRAVNALEFSLSSCEEQKVTQSMPQVSKQDLEPSPTQTSEPTTLWGELLDNISEKSSTIGDRPEKSTHEAYDISRTGQEAQGYAIVPSVIPSELRLRVQKAFDGFIGNENAVRRISRDLLRALVEKPPHLSKNYLLTGQPSTGKTELARRMANALELPFVRLDGRSVGSRERLFNLIRGELSLHELSALEVGKQSGLPVLEYPPLVIFIDEVQLLPRTVQESLLTMLEVADRTATLSDHVAKMNKATFLFATTRASDIDPAFRSRCTPVYLQEYNLNEVAEILERKLQYDWPKEIYLKIAKYGRGVPRIALQLAEELVTAITVSEHPSHSLEEYLEDVREANEIDQKGLISLDLDYLSVLERENKPIGEQTLLNLLGTVDKDRITSEIEPFLVRLGFVRLSRRGREITSEGKRYILQKRLEN